MAFSREQISQMNEAQLRTQVLIPLFRAMKFRSVMHYHGGTLELGKDIVMWKEGDLGERVNYGVVVKAEKISGQASGKGSANEVFFQIMQCFNEPFADITSIEEQRIQRCFVVSAKEISKESINAIKGSLRNNNLDKMTTFVDGDTLWDLVQKYLPEQSAFEHLQAAGEKLDQLSDHYKIIANTEGQFRIEEKYPGAALSQPLELLARLEFDTKTPEGLKAYEEFQRHIATGAPVTFKSPHLAEFRVPEFMRRLFEFSDEGMEIRIEQPPGEESLTVRIEIECEDGQRGVLDHIELKRMHGGTDEITFTNEGQSEPAKVLLVFKYKENKFKFGCRVDYAGLNVNQALQRLRFFEAMAKDGLLRVTHLDSGLEILLARVAAGQHPRPEPQWSKTLERLAVIQSKTVTPLFVPEDDIKLDEVRRIYETAHIVETGHTTFKFGQLSTSGGLKMAKNVLREFSGGRSTSMLWQFAAGQTAMILNVEIPLGPVVMSCERVMVTEEDLETLRTAIELSSPTSSLPIRFTAVEDCPVEARYLDWLPADEKASMTALIASLSSKLDPVVEGVFRAAEQDGVIDVDQLVQKLAEARQATPPAGEKTSSIAKATPEELRAALEPLMEELQPEDRFKLAAKLFEKNLLSSGKASRLAGMDRVTFLTSLHTVGVAAIDHDEAELEDQKRYIESQ